MALVLQVEAVIGLLKFGILEAKDSSNIMMPTVMRSTKSTSIQTEDTYSLQAMTLQSRFGIWDKVIYSTPYMVTKEPLHQLLSPLAVITSLLVVQTLLWWSGKVISKRTIKNSSKISELSKASTIKLEEHHLSLQEGHHPLENPLPRNLQQERPPIFLQPGR